MAENENGIFGGSGVTLIVLILFFLTMFNGGWGGGNAATQGALTRAEVQDIVSSNSIQNNLTNGFAGVNQNLCAGFGGVNQNISNAAASTALGMNTGFNSVNSNLQGLSAQMASCCCDTKTYLGSKIDAIGDLIQQNTIQELRDEIQNKDRELLASNVLSINQNQTNTLVSALRQIVNGCGCGC